MQAIITRYHGPTNTRGSRIVAHCEAGRYTMGINNAWTLEDNHCRAAMELARRLDWYGTWIAGETRDSTIWINSTWVGRFDHDSFTVEGGQ